MPRAPRGGVHVRGGRSVEPHVSASQRPAERQRVWPCLRGAETHLDASCQADVETHPHVLHLQAQAPQTPEHQWAEREECR
jgi:hypothetical protein